MDDTELCELLNHHLVNDKIKKYYDYNGTVVTNKFKDIAEDIANLEVKDSDIYVTSFPKSGTTWTQEMVWLLANNFDYKEAEILIVGRFPLLEMSGMFNLPELPSPVIQDSVGFIREMTNEPRCIKTHLPWHLLPKQIQNKEKRPKIIHVIRNPKDVCVSGYYHTLRSFADCQLSFEDFCKLFLAGKVQYCPYWNTVLNYWEQRNEPNVLIISYEEMKKDLRSVINKVANFLEKSLTDEQLDKMLKHLTFESMRENSSCNYEFGLGTFFHSGKFMRKGIVGDYKNLMSDELVQEFEEWISKNDKGLFNI